MICTSLVSLYCMSCADEQVRPESCEDFQRSHWFVGAKNSCERERRSKSTHASAYTAGSASSLRRSHAHAHTLARTRSHAHARTHTHAHAHAHAHTPYHAMPCRADRVRDQDDGEREPLAVPLLHPHVHVRHRETSDRIRKRQPGAK